MAEYLSPEAQAAHDFHRGMQEAINERDQKAIEDLKVRAAELAKEYAAEREKEAQKTAQVNDAQGQEAQDLSDAIGTDEVKVLDHPEPTAPDRVVPAGSPLDPTADDKPPAEKQTNRAAAEAPDNQPDTENASAAKANAATPDRPVIQSASTDAVKPATRARNAQSKG